MGYMNYIGGWRSYQCHLCTVGSMLLPGSLLMDTNVEKKIFWGFLMIMKRPTFENSPILAIIRGSYIIRHPIAVAMLKRTI